MSDPKLNTPSSSEMQIDNLQSNDFSLLELFFKADAVVMLVMLSLIFLSIWCWAIIFNKYFKFKNEVKTRDNFEQYFSTSEIDHSALEKFIKEKIESKTYNSFEIIYFNAKLEFSKVTSTGRPVNLNSFVEKLENIISYTITKERHRLERSMTALASIGSISPFIGLFGTVWGIMNSFQSIAMSNNTSLAVVAPGIAEALFATALGLFAAIPAVAAYNKYLKDIDMFNDKSDHFGQYVGLYFTQEIDKK